MNLLSSMQVGVAKRQLCEVSVSGNCLHELWDNPRLILWERHSKVPEAQRSELGIVKVQPVDHPDHPCAQGVGLWLWEAPQLLQARIADLLRSGLLLSLPM